MSKIRIGVIPFLNTKPIIFGLEGARGSSRFELLYRNPAESAELLASGGLDLALIPSIEYARRESLRIVPGICIASRGAARSVLLFANKPLESVESIAVDGRSRTSVALLQILCAELYNIGPKLEAMEPDPERMLGRCDAAMVIGDEALYCEPSAPEMRDLGRDWQKLTGHPFVFALYAGRADALDSGDCETLMRSLEEGLRNIDAIAAQYSSPQGLEDAAALNTRYLSEHIHYSLGDEELTGLKLFFIKAWEHGLIEGVPHLHFYEA